MEEQGAQKEQFQFTPWCDGFTLTASALRFSINSGSRLLMNPGGFHTEMEAMCGKPVRCSSKEDTQTPAGPKLAPNMLIKAGN